MITQARTSPETSLKRRDVKVSDADIVRRYLGVSKMPCSMSSPLRDNDYRPSFTLRERDGVVFYKDFGTGEGGDAVKLMSQLWHTTYSEALEQIKEDMDSAVPRTSLVRKCSGKVRVMTGSDMEVKVREWKPWDEEYWNSYGIPVSFCQWCNVYPVSNIFFAENDENGKTYKSVIPTDKYAYAFFEWKDGKRSVKLYQPFSKTMKWLSKHDSSVWDLWKQAMNYAENVSDEALIITSSRKDAMCLWYNLKVPAICMQGEGYLPKPQVMDQLKKKFRSVYIWYDNDFSHKTDNPGQDNARRLIKEYPYLINICIPEGWQCKDPSDLYKTHGKDALLKVWNDIKKH